MTGAVYQSHFNVRVMDSFRFVLISVAGWINQHQLHIIDYLREENRVRHPGSVRN